MLSGWRRMARRAIVARARDVTSSTSSRPALVLAPHPDDETLGCGATILRKVASGTQVTIAVLTDGSRSHVSPSIPPARLAALRHVEMAEAGRRLNLPEGAVRWGGFTDGELASAEDAAVDFVADLIAELQPAEVYATSALEPHPDHAALGRAAARAVASAPDVTLLEYPVWLWGAWPLQAGNRVGSAVDAASIAFARRAERVRSEQFRGAKLHALAAHESQLRRPELVPPDEEWAVLPPDVLRAASATDELFLRRSR